jgi:polyphosphate kinase
MTPIKDPAVQARIREVLTIMRRDDRRAWSLGPEGHWTRLSASAEGEPEVDTFETLQRLAAESVPGPA